MNIADLLHRTAQLTPDAPAVSFGDSLVHDWSGLRARVARLAGGLRGLENVVPGARIGLAMKNSPQYIELMWAAWHAGLCIVPMNAKLHPREFAFILENCGVTHCFASADLVHSLSDTLATQGRGRIQVIDADSADYERLAAHEPIPMAAVADNDPAWLFYTSGTTGRPKGATLTHASLLAMVLRYYVDIDALDGRDCMIHVAPLSHASGLYSVPHIACGSHQIIPESQGFDPAELFGLLEHNPSATFFNAPTMLTRLIDAPGVRNARIEHIRTIFYGGAPMYLENLKKALATLGPCLLQAYGQGETPNTITSLAKSLHVDDGHPRWEQRLASVGVARTGVEVRVVNEDGIDLSTGKIGEIICRSDVTMSGYWNNPEATLRSLRDGWLWTGDMGVLDEDGFLTLKDRSKDVIISGGSNIYPREVEEVLLQHPSILEVSVVGRHHDDWGEEVVAFVVARAGSIVDDEELNHLCLENIARFKRPKAYIHLDELPKNSYGKIPKTTLRDLLAAPKG